MARVTTDPQGTACRMSDVVIIGCLRSFRNKIMATYVTGAGLTWYFASEVRHDCMNIARLTLIFKVHC